MTLDEIFWTLVAIIFGTLGAFLLTAMTIELVTEGPNPGRVVGWAAGIMFLGIAAMVVSR